MGHPMAFELSRRLVALAGKPFSQVFFCNSGSEAVDSALKIALAYHRVRGEGQRTRLIGRERGYHGVGFGGISVGGIVGNRKMFGAMLPGGRPPAAHHDLKRTTPSRAASRSGARTWPTSSSASSRCTMRPPSPPSSSSRSPAPGVLVPPVGYLQKLREITAKHGILLIFDEVITGFGRIGKPFGFQQLGVVPDLFTVAKGINSGTVPMGAVFAREGIYEAFMQGPRGRSSSSTATPTRRTRWPAPRRSPRSTCTATRGCSTRAGELAGYWEDALHSLRGLPHVIDIRNIGLMGAVELAPRAGRPARAPSTCT
jgi:beta-alanine--pyruvate transaminase